MKQKKTTLFFASITIAMLCFATITFAQGTGRISGKVTDSESGDFLPGANLMLQGTTIGAGADREGSYRILNIPAGTYTLVVRYMGYKEHSEEVTVVADRSTLVDVKLNVSYVEMEDVVVSGLRQGQVKALAVQKEAPNIKNVVSREQMENFPDMNTAEVLQRVPGVHISRSQGDGRYVLIRGTDPRLSMVTVNGEPLASTRNEQRYSQLDIVGSNQMSSIEVIKALTPDMDANSIGGTVNIITRSAFDYPGSHLDLTVGTGYSELDGAVNWQGKLNWSDKLGSSQKFGYSITANYDRKTRGADNIEYQYDDIDDEAGNELPYVLSDIRFMDYQLTKERIGFGGGLDYRFNENNKLFFSGMWNKFIDVSQNGRMRIRVDKGDYYPSGDANILLTEDSRIIRETKGRTENLIQNVLTFGGEHLLANNTLDYIVSYSYGEENHPNQTDTEFELDEKVNLRIDVSNPETPTWKITNDDLAAGYENVAANYEFGDIDYRETFSSNTNVTAAVNFNMPYNFFGSTANLKFGSKYTTLTKDRDDNRASFDWEGDEDLYMSDWLSDRERPDFFNDNYNFGEQGDWDQIYSFYNNNRNKEDGLVGDPNIEDSKGASYKVEETVFAYYAMTDINFGNLNLLAGLRHEFTTNDLFGHILVFDDEGDFSSLQESNVEKDYNDIFPMVHLRYSLTPLTNLRFAATQTMSRPNFWDLAPHVTLDNRRERIRRGNPELETTLANNLDLMGEHYFQGIGIASAGLFYKGLSNIIFETSFDLPDDDPQYPGWEVETTVNGEDATLWGIELVWQQEFTFLPGLWSGFGIYLNYTHTWSEADLLGREGVIPGQAGDVGNVALAYEKSGFSARLSYAYQGKYIKEVGGSEDDDEWLRAHGQLDFVTAYKFTKNLSVFMEFVNLTNSAKYEYQGIEDRPIQVEYYSWWSRLGIKYTL